MYSTSWTFLSILSLSLSSRGSDHATQQQIFSPNDNFDLTPIRDALISNKIIGDVLDDFEPRYYLDVVYPKKNTQILLGNEVKPKVLKKRPRFGIHEIPGKQPTSDTGKEAPLQAFTLVLTDPDATSRYDPKWSEMCHWIVTNMTSASPNTGPDVSLNFETSYLESLGPHLPFVNDENADLTTEDSNSAPTSGRKLKSHHKYRPNLDHKNEKLETKSNLKHESHESSKRYANELEPYFAPAPPPKTGWHRYVFVLLEGDASQNLTAPKERKHWGYGKVRHGVRDWAKDNNLTVVAANFLFAKNKKQ